MKNRQLLIALGISVILLTLLVALLGCSSPAAPASSPATPSGVSLTVKPAEELAAKDKKVTFSATGLNPKEDIRIRITTSPELDVTTSVDPALAVTDSGTFETKLALLDFPPGSYTVKIIGRGEQVLATAPLTVKPAK